MPLVQGLAAGQNDINDQMIRQFQYLNKEVQAEKQADAQCQDQINEIKSLLDATNIKGVSTGSAIRKVE